MTVPSSNSLIAMLLMLIIGVGLGMLIMTSRGSSVHAVVETPEAAAPPVLRSAVRPMPEPVVPEAPTPQALEQYVGVIFARQLVDIAARSDGRLEAVYVHLGDHLRPGDAIAVAGVTGRHVRSEPVSRVGFGVGNGSCPR